MSRLLLAVGLCSTCAAYAPLGRTPRRLVAVRAESEDRAEQIKKLNDMFYGSTTATDADSTDAASAADASNPLSDLPLWRVQWNALPGERQVAQRVAGVRCAGGVCAVGVGRSRASIKHIVQLFNLFRAVLGLGPDRDEAPRRLSQGHIGMAAEPAQCYGEQFHFCSLPDLEESYK